MKLRRALSRLFVRLNTEKVGYCILRDYENVEMINEADDVDISVAEEDRSATTRILLSEGWNSPEINPNKFGHEQFFKWDDNKIIKLDILWGIYFDDGKYKLNNAQQVYETVGFLDDTSVHIPSASIGLQLLVLHLILDKHSVSKKNMVQLRRLFIDGSDWESNIASEILDKKQNELDKLEFSIDNLIKSNVIVGIDNSQWKKERKVKLKQWNEATRKIGVVIVGVDGTGKSTLVNALDVYYGSKVNVQYMGFRSFETVPARLFAGKQRIRIPFRLLNSLLYFLSTYHEMLHRLRKVKKNRFTIFDRYVWEAYDNSTDSFSKTISKFLFVDHFPKPQGIIYLYCPTEISLQRKDDIVDKNAFVAMKKHTDEAYMNNQDVCVIDTHQNTPEEVKALALEYICVISQGRYK